MSDSGVDAVDSSPSSGISSTLAAWNDPPPSSIDAWTAAMAAASSNRSVAEQSQSNGAHGTAVDKTKASDQTGGGSWRVRGLGALQAGFGVLEVVGGAVGGVASSETVVGAVAGGAVAAHGFDDIWAGVQQAKTGKPTETVTQKAVASVARHAGAPPPIAAAVGIAADIAASGGVGGAEKTAVEGTETAVQAAKGAEAASKGAEAASTKAKLARGFAQRGRPAEAKTAERLAAEHPEFNGRTFEAPPPPDPGYDWKDDLGRTYDAMGDGSKSRYFNLRQFTKSIDSHLLKDNDFTVIDMTGYTPEQVAAVREYVNGLPASSQALIRRVGF